MKCCLKRHQFRRIGRSATGMCLEKYVECSKCKMVVVIMNVHPQYRYIYDEFPKPIYYERRTLKRKLKCRFSQK